MQNTHVQAQRLEGCGRSSCPGLTDATVSLENARFNEMNDRPKARARELREEQHEP